MTIATTTFKVSANGNGSATSFSFSPMVIYENSDLMVVKTDINGVETDLVEGVGATNYAVVVGTLPTTGSITYPASGGTPLQLGESVTIKRVVPEVQLTNLQNQGPYLPETLETQLDKFVCMVQQIQEEVDRSVKSPIGSTVDPEDLIETIIDTAADSETSANLSESWYNQFQTNYLGTFVGDPALDLMGNAVITGALYFNASTGKLRVYTGSVWVDSAVASPTNFTSNVFSGTGAQTAFTLSTTPASTQSCLVHVAGLIKIPTTDFTTSGTTLTFTVAPAVGTNNILVLTVSALSVGIPADSSVTATKLAANAVTTAAVNNGAITLAKLDSAVTFGRLLNVVSVTSSGTYTKNASSNYVLVHVLGGGGGSGSAVGGASTTSFGGSGAGGGYSFKKILTSALAASETVTIGAGGTAAASGSAVKGGDGGTTSFGAWCSATGGKGGCGIDSAGNSADAYIPLGGIGSSGDINLRGGPGVAYQASQSQSQVFTSNGGKGAGPYGGPGAVSQSRRGNQASNAQAGAANTGEGAAGGNTLYNNGASTVAGAVGGSGIVIVFEYS